MMIVQSESVHQKMETCNGNIEFEVILAAMGGGHSYVQPVLFHSIPMNKIYEDELHSSCIGGGE